jgi:hypothetical protein
MTKEQFLKNNRGINGDKDLDPEYLGVRRSHSFLICPYSWNFVHYVSEFRVFTIGSSQMKSR